MERFDVIIVGAGPGGLSCARTLAEAGLTPLVLERGETVGPKICGGGITWDGLIREVPARLLEQTSHRQLIFSNHQRIDYRRKDPIIATVNRENLGQWMLENAVAAGAEVRTGWRVTAMAGRHLRATTPEGDTRELAFSHLVGADGSASLVRRTLNIPAVRRGIGINYQVPGRYEHMEWHLNHNFFGNGYGWIFPHRDTVSIGAYQPTRTAPPARLKQQLVTWAAARGFDLTGVPGRAGLINYDYRGHRFGNRWLVGDAAGLASGLTGEGINPAIVSGRAVARTIIDPDYPAYEITKMLKKQRRHREIVDLSGLGPTVCTLLMESLLVMLRLRLVDFQKQLSL